jgi:DNA-binding MarR family transcriptional regulator
MPKPPASVSPAQRRALEGAKSASVGQLLLKCARLFDEAAIARVNREVKASGPKLPPLRPAHTKLFPHIDFEGTRLGTIAERLGVTKQAVSQWIAELEEMKVVELVADPDDARAKRVRFTPRGLEGIHHGLSVLRAIEDDVATRVGAKTMRELHGALLAIAPVLESFPTD